MSVSSIEGLLSRKVLLRTLENTSVLTPLDAVQCYSFLNQLP